MLEKHGFVLGVTGTHVRNGGCEVTRTYFRKGAETIQIRSLWPDFGSTLGRLWTDLGSTLGGLWANFGSTLGQLWGALDWLWVDFGLTLGQLWVDFGLTFD